jgi:hypothetical protein
MSLFSLLFLFRLTIGTYYHVRHLTDFIPYITCVFCIDSSGADTEQITTFATPASALSRSKGQKQQCDILYRMG